MRIVHVITRLILGGAQENTLLTVEGLHHKFGDDVTLITGPPLGPEGSLLERAQEQGLQLRVVDELRREVNLVRDWRSYRRLTALIELLRPEVVHTHSSKAGILGRAAARKAAVPVIVHGIHGAPFHRYETRLRNRIYIAAEKWAARRTDAYVSVCDSMTDQFVRAKIAPRDRFRTIYSGMETAGFLAPTIPRQQRRNQLGYGDQHIVVGKIARLFDLKGHEDVIAVAPELIRNYPNVRFLFIGDGTLKEALQKRLDQLGIADYFHFAGLVPPQEIPELLHAMDIVVHCSLREGLARVLPQALLAKRPVVSYDIDGAKEVVLPDVTGFLVPPRDLGKLYDALARLSADPLLRARLGEEGCQRFANQFDHEQMTAEIRNLYEELLQRT